MSMQTGRWNELVFSNKADHTAVASTNAEATLLAGTNLQPTLQPTFWDDMAGGRGRLLRVRAMGVLSNTATPTLIFQVRLSATQGSSTLTGTSLGVSAAITTISGVTNVWWELFLDILCRTPGQGTTSTTLAGAGYVMSPAGFAAPYQYPLEPTTPDTATWTATCNNAVANYLNLSCTWSASSSSNTITCKHLVVEGLG